MKVKRFNNIWTMGLILFGAILIVIYIAKIFFPQWIIGVAEIPAIVKFGNYVDSHKWAYYLFHFTFSIVSTYFYYCACARVTKLNWKQWLVSIVATILSLLLREFAYAIYTPYTYVMLIICPFVIAYIDDNINHSTFISTAICFTVDIMAQALIVQIRNIILYANAVNSATVTILLIDLLIWRVLFYLYFNKEKGDK